MVILALALALTRSCCATKEALRLVAHSCGSVAALSSRRQLNGGTSTRKPRRCCRPPHLPSGA